MEYIKIFKSHYLTGKALTELITLIGNINWDRLNTPQNEKVIIAVERLIETNHYYQKNFENSFIPERFDLAVELLSALTHLSLELDNFHFIENKDETYDDKIITKHLLISKVSDLRDIFRGYLISISTDRLARTNRTVEQLAKDQKSYDQKQIDKFENLEHKIASIKLENEELTSKSETHFETVMQDVSNSIEKIYSLSSKLQQDLSDQALAHVRSTQHATKSFESDVTNLTSNAQVTLNKQLDNLSETLESKRDSLIREIENKLDLAVQDRQKEIDDLKRKTEEDHRAFKAIYHEMVGMFEEAGDEKLARHNLEQATHEKEAADRLRNFGIGLLFVVVGSAIFFLIQLTTIENAGILDWFLPRFLTLTFCTAPAVYILKESASHRHKENLYRQRGTQLATLGAYLGDFNHDKKMDVKGDLAKNFYTFNDGKADTSNVPDFIAQLKDVATAARTFNRISPSGSQAHQKQPPEPITVERTTPPVSPTGTNGTNGHEIPKAGQ